MGVPVNYEARLFFGTAFTFEEIIHLKSQKLWTDLANEIQPDEVQRIWEKMGYLTASPYFDAPNEDLSYVIGIDLTGKSLSEIKALDEAKIVEEVKAECAKLNVSFREPKLLILPHIWF